MKQVQKRQESNYLQQLTDNIKVINQDQCDASGVFQELFQSYKHYYQGYMQKDRIKMLFNQSHERNGSDDLIIHCGTITKTTNIFICNIYSNQGEKPLKFKLLNPVQRLIMICQQYYAAKIQIRCISSRFGRYSTLQRVSVQQEITQQIQYIYTLSRRNVQSQGQQKAKLKHAFYYKDLSQRYLLIMNFHLMELHAYFLFSLEQLFLHAFMDKFNKQVKYEQACAPYQIPFFASQYFRIKSDIQVSCKVAQLFQRNSNFLQISIFQDTNQYINYFVDILLYFYCLVFTMNIYFNLQLILTRIHSPRNSQVFLNWKGTPATARPGKSEFSSNMARRDMKLRELETKNETKDHLLIFCSDPIAGSGLLTQQFIEIFDIYYLQCYLCLLNKYQFQNFLLKSSINNINLDEALRSTTLQLQINLKYIVQFLKNSTGIQSQAPSKPPSIINPRCLDINYKFYIKL
ncbi:unnamed protein product [Paramecium octaurelia]|uniref:Uncharacterized protein n=1 Tax=Paramecium octaurelia TaxID=43137 RepID=A0A8S1XGC1_PAROT|nr:unnamed protein product [Paramecium octaurelia]